MPLNFVNTIEKQEEEPLNPSQIGMTCLMKKQLNEIQKTKSNIFKGMGTTSGNEVDVKKRERFTGGGST